MRRVSFRFRWTAFLSSAIVGALAFASLASASDVNIAVVDVTAPPGAVTLAPGESGAITINVSVTGNQAGTATFEVFRNWTLAGGTFTGSNPQEFTVGPRAGGDPATTFNTSGTVSVAAGHNAGSFTLAVGAFDITNSNATGGKLAAGAAGTYHVTVPEVTPPPTDTTAPSISYALTPSSPDGDDGWYKSDVTLIWTVTESESPASLVKTGCDDQVISADQFETEYSCAASSDGGTAGPVSVSVKRDATAPTVALVGGPAGNGSYYFGFVPDAPTCTASDATSGLEGSCNVSGYSDSVGTHTVTASAYDEAGNEGSASVTYTVHAWTVNGFLHPVDMGVTVWNTVKGGSTVPLKFSAYAGGIELTDPAFVVSSFTQVRITCPGGTQLEDPIEVLTTGGTTLRYDAVAHQFIQNWQTPKQPGACYKVTLTTRDGQPKTASFKLK